MSIEIERKFLVKPWCLPDSLMKGGMRLSQGYLSLDPVVRIRVDSTNAWLTVKGKTTGISRNEFEYPVPIPDALDMLDMCKHKLSKTRRKIQIGKHVWEVDEFHENLTGLWLAEVELCSENEEVEIPEWIDKEVSDDPCYYNSSLCQSP